jgi:hypothetical protein
MRNLFLFGIPVLAAACGQLLTASPALAQEAQYRMGRETAGYIEQRGWEAGLVKANPNLSHFMWSPVTTMIQAPVAVRVGTVVRMNPPHNPVDTASNTAPAAPAYRNSAYVKPAHLPTVIAEGSMNGNDLGGRLVPRHYVKAIKAELNGSLLPRHYVKPVHEDVSARLVSHNTDVQLLTQAPMHAAPFVASYGEGPHVQRGSMTRSKADVNGLIVSRGRLLQSQ